nr:hypothetical protein [Comamonas sp.]
MPITHFELAPAKVTLPNPILPIPPQRTMPPLLIRMVDVSDPPMAQSPSLDSVELAPSTSITAMESGAFDAVRFLLLVMDPPFVILKVPEPCP